MPHIYSFRAAALTTETVMIDNPCDFNLSSHLLLRNIYEIEKKIKDTNLFCHACLIIQCRPMYLSSSSISSQSGAAAGTTVDLTLHPIDTIKTRLQSSAGFWKSGGFRGMYSGILPAAAGSAPSGNLATPVYN